MIGRMASNPSRHPQRYVFVAGGYSDDCAHITGTDPELDEYEVFSHWFEARLDGRPIGRMRMDYHDGGWRFEFVSDEHELRAGAVIDADDDAAGGEVAPAADVEIEAFGETCRVCGCTDEDCGGCVERTGQPCYWVEEDLCSACVVPVDEALAPPTDAEIEAVLARCSEPDAGALSSALREAIEALLAERCRLLASNPWKHLAAFGDAVGADPSPEHLLEAWRRLDPCSQGIAHYMRAELPEGALLPRECPYAEGTPQRRAWDRGVQVAIMSVMDVEE